MVLLIQYFGFQFNFCTIITCVDILKNNLYIKHNKYQSFRIFSNGINGRIINISSILSRVSLYGGILYCSSKAALTAFNNCLRPELNSLFGIYMSNIEPSFIETNLTSYVTSKKIHYQVWNNNVNDKNNNNHLNKIYDKEKFVKHMGTFEKITNLVMQTSLDKTMNSIITALSSKFPLPFYQPSMIASIACLIGDVNNFIPIGNFSNKMLSDDLLKDEFYP